MYNMMTIANCHVIYRKVVKRGNPKSSHHKENFFLILFSFLLYLYE